MPPEGRGNGIGPAGGVGELCVEVRCPRNALRIHRDRRHAVALGQRDRIWGGEGTGGGQWEREGESTRSSRQGRGANRNAR
jgi:hypothetical protein